MLKLSPEHAMAVINLPIRDPTTGQIEQPASVELDLNSALESEEPMPGEEKAVSEDSEFMEKYIE